MSEPLRDMTWCRRLAGRKSVVFLLYVLLTVICIASFQFRVYDQGPSFHGDESTVLANARAFWLLVNGDIYNEYWQRYESWALPHAGHYVYAIVLRAAGFGPSDLNLRYIFERDRDWNVAHGRIPSKKMLLTARRFSALCGALACVLLCEIGRRTFGWPTGLVAAPWLAFNPLMRFSCQRAMLDGQLVLALVGGALLMLVFFRAWQHRSALMVLLLSVGVGLFFGFAASLKYSAGILCVMSLAGLGCLAVHVLLQKRHGLLSMRSAVKKLMVAVVSVVVVIEMAIGTFYVLNPQIWQSGIVRGSQIMLELRTKLVSAQQQWHRDHALTSIPQRVTMGNKMLFVKWPTLRKDMALSLLSPEIAGRKSHGLWYIEGTLFGLGLVVLLMRLVRRVQREHCIDPTCVIALWLCFYSIFVFLAMPLRWPRYYHKYLPLQALLVAIGLAFLIEVTVRLTAGRCRRYGPAN